ncbi:MAG: hypothetical protein LBT33_09045 [Spirochaetia bacterium]|jgi:hypothetical protein|nr:hypothetical protein [Spirochaetia bacterium]
MMKGLCVWFLAAAALFMGCYTDLGLYDPAVPLEETCRLNIDTRLGITGFNGKPVSWGHAREGAATIICIPPGEHSLRFEFYYRDDNIEASAANYAFVYDFLPGHEYDIEAEVSFLGKVEIVVEDLSDDTSQTFPLGNMGLWRNI